MTEQLSKECCKQIAVHLGNLLTLHSPCWAADAKDEKRVDFSLNTRLQRHSVDTNTLIGLIVGGLVGGTVAVVGLLRFRRKASVELEGPGGTKLKFAGENEPAAQNDQNPLPS